MQTFGLFPQNQLVQLEHDQVPESDIRARFGLGDAAFALVPFVDAEKPAEVPGFVWVPGEEWSAEAVTRTWSQQAAPPPTPAEQMTAARAAMAAILDELDLADRMNLQSLRVQVEAALDKGQTDLALYIVTQAEVEPHLLPVKAQILELFPQS